MSDTINSEGAVVVERLFDAPGAVNAAGRAFANPFSFIWVA